MRSVKFEIERKHPNQDWQPVRMNLLTEGEANTELQKMHEENPKLPVRVVMVERTVLETLD